MLSTLWTWMRWPVYISGGLLGASGGALYIWQNELIYPRGIPPDARTTVPRPPQFGIEDYEELSLPTPDGETLSAFLVNPPNKNRTLPIIFLAFHGNAGNIGHRLPIAKYLAEELYVSTLMLEYRGYGLSTGTPNESGIAIDAQTALDYIRHREDLKRKHIVIYGQSLGGAVSIDLVAKNKGTGDIKALIIENTFLSIPKMVPSVLPAARYLVPLCREQWRSEEKIGSITDIPILFLSGLKDEIVPPIHMKELFKLARTNKAIWKELPDGDHNNTVSAPWYFKHVHDFLANYVLR